MTGKRYLLFDFDGTIVDSMEGITKGAALALESFGIHVENRDSLCSFIGPPLEDSFLEYGLSREQTAQALDRYREYYHRQGMFECTPYPGIGPLLDRLNGHGFTVMLATSKPQYFAEEIMRRFGLLERFAVISGAGMDGSHHRKADVIRRALAQRPEASLDQALMIGDRKYDVLGAKEVGLPCVGVLYGFGSPEELAQAGAVRLATDLPELEQILLEE